MDESELVIVCHCEKHPQLYTVKDNKLDKPIDNKKVSFVDPSVCGENTWEKIASNSKQYVWGFNCPVGPALTNPEFDRSAFWTAHLLDILENSKRVLKPGGQFISGIGNTIDIDTIDLNKFVNVPEMSSWKIKVVKGSDYVFNLGKIQLGYPPDIKYNLMVFTKVSAGGKRKKRTTRRRKTRRNKCSGFFLKSL